MDQKPFKVIIVGGSIAGLSLALMLERNGIDFVILEAYPNIAPQVGASFGVLPNGFRILDQLGCYESIIEKAGSPVDTFCFRDSQGKAFWTFDNFNEASVGSHGYPVVFLERRMLIEVLYGKIQDKSKVITSQRVQSIENGTSSATVTTATGQTYTGNMVIGADGIHSKVRQEMWKAAGKVDPTWIDPKEESALPATYACIFGISKGVEGIEKGTLSSVFNEHFSYLVPSGPGDITYWFLVRNMGKTYYGADIPRFTKEEEEAFAAEHLDDQITPTLKFSALYKSKIASAYSTFPEYVYKKWYFQRTMTIGDASHKFEPLTGQGGNNAMETAASLTNHLVAALKHSQSGTLSTAEISKIFESVQQQREGRAWGLVKASHVRQRLECMETPLLKFMVRYVVPHFSKSMILSKWIDTYSPAVSLDMLPLPHRPREIPYFDERFRTPSSRGVVSILLYAVYFFLAWLGQRQLSTAIKANGTMGFVRQAIKSQSVSLPGGVEAPLRQVYTGVGPIDLFLKVIVTIFLPAITNFSTPEQPLQVLYFLGSMMPIIAIWTVEGFRPRNKWTLLAMPSIWAVLYQLRGIGLIAPLYFGSSTYLSSRIAYFSPSTRTLPESTARAILPALVLGFIVPTTMLFFPLADALTTRQVFIALWQPSPIYVVILTQIFSRVIKSIGSRTSAKTDNTAAEGKANRDIPHLQTLYAVAGGVSACFHVALLLTWAASGTNFITKAFIPSDAFAQVATLADGVFVFFQNDFLLVAAATLLWCLASVWDLYRLGVSNVSWQVALAGLILGSLAIGPGATAAAVWYWREEVMSRTSFLRHGPVSSSIKST
ncbi:Monooxygenase FAD-binding [Penicillium concentricum]|uniref:Monooxygenase FAD-binding n=1 Tax=Penicillium concentricum TaxID=293559 RepID=A0A9W9UVZ7_9EURO|nr:Monooxygenase FAD-binding [Penicillium concentricum]KAJ5356786.1 Monooxygenase FAD-binding [Penicillium concentricum]